MNPRESWRTCAETLRIYVEPTIHSHTSTVEYLQTITDLVLTCFNPDTFTGWFRALLRVGDTGPNSPANRQGAQIRVGYGKIIAWGRPFLEWLVGGLEHFYFPIYWEWSSQLTNTFQRGSNHQPVRVALEWSDKLLRNWPEEIWTWPLKLQTTASLNYSARWNPLWDCKLFIGLQLLEE